MDIKSIKQALARKKKAGKNATTARREVAAETGASTDMLTAIAFDSLTSSDCGSSYDGGSSNSYSSYDSGSSSSSFDSGSSGGCDSGSF